MIMRGEARQPAAAARNKGELWRSWDTRRRRRRCPPRLGSMSAWGRVLG